MKSEIIVALITGLCIAIPSVITTISSSKSAIQKNKDANALTLYRLEQLEKKVDTYNTFSERVAIIERDLKTAFSRIDEIKKER